MAQGDGIAATILDVRALGGRVELRSSGTADVIISPHDALAIAQRLIDAAAAAEGQKLLLREAMTRGTRSGLVGQH